jgi:hypothetical protein
MTFHWPQFTAVALLLLSLGHTLAKHGEPRDGKYNFWGGLFATVLWLFVWLKGGFFGGVQ